MGVEDIVSVEMGKCGELVRLVRVNKPYSRLVRPRGALVVEP